MKILALALLTTTLAAQTVHQVLPAPVPDNLTNSVKDLQPSGPTQGNNGQYYAVHVKGMSSDGYVRVEAKDGTRMERLSDAEYAQLQHLREAIENAKAAVEDFEKTIAASHGWNAGNTNTRCTGADGSWCGTWSNGPYVEPDRYEFHGQFLLITPRGGR